MNYGFPAIRLRSFPASLRRVSVGAAAAALLVLAVPAPVAAAPTPSVTITDVTVAEGTGGTVDANFTIRVAPRPRTCCPLQVSWATAPGTATAPDDFTASSGTVSLTRAASSRVVSVPVAGDATIEPNETFVVNLSNLVGSPGRIGDGQGLATITNDDTLPLLSVNDVTVAEGDAGTTTATFTASLSAASGTPVTFDWTTSAGSASDGLDYVAASGSGTIAAGSTGTTIDVTVNGDVLDEVDETFGITLSNPGNATIADGSGLGTITDDDPLPVLSIDDVSVTEGNAGTSVATFAVTLSAASGQTVTVGWATADGSAAQLDDYASGSGTLTFVPGSTSETLPVTVNGDLTAELDETFSVNLSAPSNATLGDAQGVGTIVDDELEPVIDIDDPTVVEGQSGTAPVTFSVTLSNPSASDVTVEWSTAAGTATGGTDYVTTSGTLTIPAGETTGTVDVVVNGDGTYEGDETLAVNLSNATGAPIGDTQGIATITNDDAAPSVSLADASVVEGNSGTSLLTFAVSLIGPSDVDAQVDFATAGVTATGGTDYVTTSGTLTIPAGETTGTVDVVVNGDGTYEGDETLSLILSNPTDAIVGDGAAQGTITNDDAAPSVSLADASVVEGNSGTSLLTFAASLIGPSDVAASLDFDTAGVTATGGTDYVTASGTLTIPAGETSGTVDVVVNGDLVYESNETLSLTLSNPTDAIVGDGAAQGTIANDDRAPTTVTLRIVKRPRALLAKGILEPTKSGHRVTATLFRKQSGKFVKIAAKTVRVRYFRDRDGDGKTDGSYTATFLRPRAGGTYKVLVRFKGTATHKPCSRAKIFRLPPS
jgi:hypothetical protein